MSLEVQATYEGGVLRPDRPLPFQERQRVTVTVTSDGTSNSDGTSIHETAGLLAWTGKPEDLDYLLGPENPLRKDS